MSNRVLMIVSIVFVTLLVAAGVGRILWAGHQQAVAADPQTHYLQAEAAIVANDATRLGALIDRYPHVTGTHSDVDGATLLHVAMNNGGDAISCLMLIDEGADVNAVDHAGRTPLHVLCTFTTGLINEETVRLLSDNGADMNATDDAGGRAIEQMVAESDMYAEVFPDYFTNPTTQNRNLLKKYGAVD